MESVECAGGSLFEQAAPTGKVMAGYGIHHLNVRPGPARHKDMNGAPEGISTGQIGVTYALWADQNWQRRQA